MTETDPEVVAYSERGQEARRLIDKSVLERVRTEALLHRYLPPPPATVLDVGGGPGVYASSLADSGYTVRLIDLVPLHVEQATELA